MQRLANDLLVGDVVGHRIHRSHGIAHALRGLVERRVVEGLDRGVEAGGDAGDAVAGEFAQVDVLLAERVVEGAGADRILLEIGHRLLGAPPAVHQRGDMAFEIVLVALALEAGEGILAFLGRRQRLHLVLVRRGRKVDALVEDRHHRDHLRVDLDQLVGLAFDPSEFVAQFRDRDLGLVDIVERGLDDALDPLDVLGAGDVEHGADLVLLGLELALLGVVLGLLHDDCEDFFAAGLQAVDGLGNQQLLGGDLGLGRFLDAAEQARLRPQLGDVMLERHLFGIDLADLGIGVCRAAVPVGFPLAVLFDLRKGVQHHAVAGGAQGIEPIQVVDQRPDHLAEIEHALVHVGEGLLHLGKHRRRRQFDQPALHQGALLGEIFLVGLELLDRRLAFLRKVRREQGSHLPAACLGRRFRVEDDLGHRIGGDIDRCGLRRLLRRQPRLDGLVDRGRFRRFRGWRSGHAVVSWDTAASGGTAERERLDRSSSFVGQW